MIAAIYARKSNQQDNIAKDAKSVARQVEHARAYAARKGWTVSEDHIYFDDGISGAEFANRPGFVRLMNTLKPAPAFQVLIMSEESRLGREMIETSYALKQIVQAGVRIYYYMEDRERTLDSPTDKILMAVNAYAGELEREMARQRARDAAVQRAKNGYSTGGRCFGYQNVRTDDGHVFREINHAEAIVVRRIFDLCAAGKGQRRIAKTLNSEAAPAPRPRRGRPRGWAPSSVRSILYRLDYKGEVVWGKSQKRDTWGQVRYQRRPENEWVRVDLPELRIVSDDLWDAAHERLQTSRKNYLRSTDGRLWGKPGNGVESKHLLTGMALCGSCGGNMMARRRHRYENHYVCASNFLRGDSVCRNNVEIRMDTADSAVLDVVERELLCPEVIELAMDKLVKKVNEPDPALNSRREQVSEALMKTEQELGNLQSAIAAGGDLQTLLDGVRERERRRDQLRRELHSLDALPAMQELAHGLKLDVLRHLEQWQGLLGGQVATSRQLLRKVLDGRMVFTPRRKADEIWYDVSGSGSVAPVLAGVSPLKAMVAVRGIEPRSRG